MRFLVISIIIILVIVMMVWWWYGVYIASNDFATTDANFQPLINDFNTYPYVLWFSDSRLVLDKNLAKNPYRYRIFTSDGKLFYDNRCDEPSENLTRSFEYILAASIGMGEILRDGILNLGIKVTFGSVERVVHISTPNYIA